MKKIALICCFQFIGTNAYTEGASYDFDIDDRGITAAFEGSPDVSFATEGQDVDPWGAVVGGGLTWMTNNRISMSVKYEGEFREAYESHGVMGPIRYAF